MSGSHNNDKEDHLIPKQPIQLPEKYAHLTPIEYTQTLIDYIETYRTWTTLHIVDFMTRNQWENVLPEEWRRILLPEGELGDEWIESIIGITSGSKVNVGNRSVTEKKFFLTVMLIFFLCSI